MYYLRQSNLGNNFLTGTLPESMTNLQNLGILDLSNNDLEGAFPEWVHGLEKLLILNLGQNRFTGDVPLVVGGRLNSLRDHFRPHTTRHFQEQYASLWGKYMNFFRTRHPYLTDSKDFLWISNRQSPFEYKDYVNAYIEAIKAVENPRRRITQS